MPFGSVDDVRNAIVELKAELSNGVGYILAPAHHIQADTSLENIKLFCWNFRLQPVRPTYKNKIKQKANWHYGVLS